MSLLRYVELVQLAVSLCARVHEAAIEQVLFQDIILSVDNMGGTESNLELPSTGTGSAKEMEQHFVCMLATNFLTNGHTYTMLNLLLGMLRVNLETALTLASKRMRRRRAQTSASTAESSCGI